MKPTQARFKAARKLIEDEDNWCTGSYCKRKSGGTGFVASYPVDDVSEYRFCAIGALMQVCSLELRDGDDWVMDIFNALGDAALELYGDSIAHVNDRIGHQAVLRIYDKLIEEKHDGII